MEAISDLPMLHDIDADSSPGSFKGRIESGEYQHMEPVPSAALASEHGVSITVAYAALAMLAANSYVGLVRGLKCYRVRWDANHGFPQPPR